MLPVLLQACAVAVGANAVGSVCRIAVRVADVCCWLLQFRNHDHVLMSV